MVSEDLWGVCVDLLGLETIVFHSGTVGVVHNRNSIQPVELLTVTLSAIA